MRVYQFRHTGIERHLYLRQALSAKENRNLGAIRKRDGGLASTVWIGKLLRARKDAAARTG
ncbi:MAG: hypothetical protein ABSD08_05530 [Xanthobacteraceae bacterium]